ncbi:MAG TPA: SRPBCC domain-containing protein, partial [Candidatus Limnocylindrales bacterium]|nr:SRPBCC domain-containing protein [Candidatus Limnocylindrales bacterium]
PREWPLAVCKIDLRVGGKWHYAMKSSSGEEAWGLGIYEEVKAPERLVYSDAFSDPEGNLNPDLPVSKVAIDFEELSGRTRVVSVSTMASEADVETLVNMGMIPGITETWDRLEEYLTAK